MRKVEDLVTDIAAIVTSGRSGELMSLKKIEEDYRALYNCPIPHCEFGFSSVEKLLEAFPHYFKFSMADGILIIRTGTKSNITELIAKERKSKRSKNFVLQSGQSNSLFKKHKRKEMRVEPQLPITTIKNIDKMINNSKCPIRKDVFTHLFEEKCGYELKYLDYGYLNLDDLFNSLNGKVLSYENNLIYPLPTMRKTFNDYLEKILTSSTGFTVSAMQESINNITQEKISDMMKSEGFVNFIDVIYDASTKNSLSFDFDLIYPHTDRIALKSPLYPCGVCHIKFLRINTPHDFFFKIIANEQQPSIESIDERMQECSSQMKLLSMFKDNKICAVEYDGFWYRAKIVSLSCQKNFESVTLRFIDHDIETEHGIQISLPTDRLRFLPPDLEVVPAFIYKGSLAYVKPIGGGYKWTLEACDKFSHLVTNNSHLYQAFVSSQDENSVSIDVVAQTTDGERISIFHVLGKENIAKVEMKSGYMLYGK